MVNFLVQKIEESIQGKAQKLTRTLLKRKSQKQTVVAYNTYVPVALTSKTKIEHLLEEIPQSENDNYCARCYFTPKYRCGKAGEGIEY